MKLTQWELRSLSLLAASLLPSPGRGLPGAGELDLAPFFHQLHERFPPLARLGLRAAILALSLGPLFFIGRFATFRGLAPGERERLLSVVATSPRYLVRQLAQLLKTVVCFGYFRAPSVREALGLANDDRPAR